MLTKWEVEQAQGEMRYWSQEYRENVDITKPIEIDLTLAFAKLAHLGYPQYRGYFNDPNYRVYRAKRNLTTKTGYKVRKGNYFVGKPGEIEPDTKTVVLILFGEKWVNHTHFNPKHFEEVE